MQLFIKKEEQIILAITNESKIFLFNAFYFLSNSD